MDILRIRRETAGYYEVLTPKRVYALGTDGDMWYLTDWTDVGKVWKVAPRKRDIIAWIKEQESNHE